MADHEQPTDVACSDPALSEELRDALTLLRDRSDHDEFRTLVDDVLAGRQSLFDASSTAAFGQAVFAPVVQEFDRRFADLSEEERHAAAAAGEAESAALCADLHQHAVSGETGSAHGPCGSPCSTCTSLCGLAGHGASPPN